MKGLDHIVLCVHDLDASADAYRELGFTVTPRARHPFGTHNNIVQLDGFFLELLTVAEPEKIPPATPGHFGFAQFNQQYLAKKEGFSMLVMDTDDFRNDNVVAREAGLDTYELFQFTRKMQLPTNELVDVSFGLNFVTNHRMPMAAFFTCQQFQPEYFWKKEYQRHQNNALRICEVCLVAENPGEIAPFMTAFTGCDVSWSGGADIHINTARGRIAILTPASYQDRYRAPVPDMDAGPQFAGFTIATDGKPSDPAIIGCVAILFETDVKASYSNL